MSLSGSLPRRWWGLFPGRRRAAARAPRPPALSVGRVARDFARWESEFAAAPPLPAPVGARPATLTTVVGTRVVEVTIGHRPIEEIALHLRRLRAVMDTMTTDVSFVRYEGIVRSYDDYLFAACHLLEVPTDLVRIGFGRHRDEERVRLERLLGQAGLRVR